MAKSPDADLSFAIEEGRAPRAEYLELAARLGAEILDYDSVKRSNHPTVRWLARHLGSRWALAFLGYARRREVGAFYVTGEDVGIPLGLLRLARPWPGQVTVVIHNALTFKRRLLMRVLGLRAFDHMIVLGDAQRRFLVAEVGLPEKRVTRLLNWVDHRFFQPAPAAAARAAGDYVLSVGMEVRDYPTLLAAAQGLPYPVRVVGSGFSPGSGYAPATGLFSQANVTLGKGYTPQQLRELYAGARLVVVPLHPVGYAAGVTAALEAMAMGKPVIATASPGLLDYLGQGAVGRLVPPHDPAALRQALVELWERPEERAAIGQRNRAWIEQHDNTELYVEQVAQLMGWPAAVA